MTVTQCTLMVPSTFQWYQWLSYSTNDSLLVPIPKLDSDLDNPCIYESRSLWGPFASCLVRNHILLAIRYCQASERLKRFGKSIQVSRLVSSFRLNQILCNFSRGKQCRARPLLFALYQQNFKRSLIIIWLSSSDFSYGWWLEAQLGKMNGTMTSWWFVRASRRRRQSAKLTQCKKLRISRANVTCNFIRLFF